jgi:hypothetical protein
MSIVSGGKTQIAANTGAIANGDNIAAYLIDSAGALLTSTLIGGKQRLDVVSPSEFAEDSAHASGDYGQMALAVRSDAGGSLVSADGDYSPFSIDASGRLRVVADLTAAFDYNYAEDSAHASGDNGAFILGVRNDANATLTSADGDYSPLATDSAGRLKIVASGVFAEDSAASSGDLGQFVLAVRRDTVGATAGTNGDYSELQTNAVGKLRAVQTSDSTVLQQVVTVGTTAVALPSTALANRESMMIQNLGTNNRDIYVGSATVTSSGATRGPVIGKGGFMTLDVGPNVAVYGIASGAGGEVAVLEMA